MFQSVPSHMHLFQSVFTFLGSKVCANTSWKYHTMLTTNSQPNLGLVLLLLLLNGETEKHKSNEFAERYNRLKLHGQHSCKRSVLCTCAPMCCDTCVHVYMYICMQLANVKEKQLRCYDVHSL